MGNNIKYKSTNRASSFYWSIGDQSSYCLDWGLCAEFYGIGGLQSDFLRQIEEQWTHPICKVLWAHVVWYVLVLTKIQLVVFYLKFVPIGSLWFLSDLQDKFYTVSLLCASYVLVIWNKIDPFGQGLSEISKHLLSSDVLKPVDIKIASAPSITFKPWSKRYFCIHRNVKILDKQWFL